MANSEPVVDALNRLIGDSYILYAKTHSYHWNVTGPQFHTLHTMFEEQYRAQWESLDVIAERIRALGAFAPISLHQMASYASIDEDQSTVPSAQDMLRHLISAHGKWLDSAKAALDIASENGDTGTEDMVTPLIGEHEKTVWMLKSSLGE